MIDLSNLRVLGAEEYSSMCVEKGWEVLRNRVLCESPRKRARESPDGVSKLARNGSFVSLATCTDREGSAAEALVELRTGTPI